LGEIALSPTVPAGFQVAYSHLKGSDLRKITPGALLPLVTAPPKKGDQLVFGTSKRLGVHVLGAGLYYEIHLLQGIITA
jgi:hypothetical protein